MNRLVRFDTRPRLREKAKSEHERDRELREVPYPRLFQEFELAGKRLKNRIVHASMSTGRAIDGKVGSHVVMARRRGAAWYVGAMTDSARTLTLDLTFLPAGTFTLESWEDGPNAARNAMDYVRRTRKVTRADRVELRVAPVGGYAARIR